MLRNATFTRALSVKTRKAARTLNLLALVTLFALSVRVGLAPAQAQSSEGTTSSKLVLVAQKMIIGAAKVGLEEAGTRLMGSSWPYLKAALSPLLEELKVRYPGFATVLDGSGPNAVAEATRVAEKISTDPHLQSLIIDGFANLKNGQREIVNRIGEMQAVLQRENESIMALQRASDEKLERILAQVNELARQKPNAVYTEGVSMYDLEGVWTLVEFRPPLPASCEFEQGKYGLSLEAVDALSASGTYKFPLPLTPDEKKALFPDSGTLCPTLISGGDGSPVTRMTLYGSLLRLGIGHTFVLTREVEISANRMTLSWIAEGRRKRWIFQRNP